MAEPRSSPRGGAQRGISPGEGLKGESSGKGAQAHLAPPLDLPLCATNMLIPDGVCKFIAQTDVTPY